MSEEEAYRMRKGNFTNYISDRGLVSRIYEELKKMNAKKISKKWSKELNGILKRWLSDGQETFN